MAAAFDTSFNKSQFISIIPAPASSTLFPPGTAQTRRMRTSGFGGKKSERIIFSTTPARSLKVGCLCSSFQIRCVSTKTTGLRHAFVQDCHFNHVICLCHHKISLQYSSSPPHKTPSHHWVCTRITLDWAQLPCHLEEVGTKTIISGPRLSLPAT